MSTPTFQSPDEDSVAPQVVYPPAVQRYITEYEQLPENEFRDVLADALFDENPVELAALHSDALVERTFYATIHLINNANNTLYRKVGENDRQHEARVRQFRDVVGVERRRAQALVENLRARQGRASNAPSPRARAARELQRRHAKEYVELVRHFRDEIQQEEAARKAERKRQRRASRR